MISETAGAGVIRQDVQQAIERELQYRLGEGDAPGALSRGQKELLLRVIHTVKANACLSQLHARAAVKAGATLAQVLQVIQSPLRKGYSRFGIWLRCSASHVRRCSCTRGDNCKTIWTKLRVSKISK